jgi:hypothetical protein
MKELHIIKSETPGITKIKKTVTKYKQIKDKSGNIMFTTTDFTVMEKQRKEKKYKNKKIQKIYRSPWGSNTYFIRHFM